MSQLVLQMQQQGAPTRFIDDVGAPSKSVDFAGRDRLEELIAADADLTDLSVGERSWAECCAQVRSSA